MHYADVYVDVSATRTDQSYQYLIPEELSGMIVPGSRVRVPFGYRSVTGYVIGLSDELQVDPEKLRDIESVENEALGSDGQLLSLAAWMHANYGGTMSQALRCVLPSAKKQPPRLRKIIHLAADRQVLSDELAVLLKRSRHSLGRERLIRELLESPDIPWDEATGRLSVSSAVIRDLEKKGLISIESIRSYRDPLGRMRSSDSNWTIPTLNPAQRAIADDFAGEFDSGIRRTYLIHGVTGSGKTEVYMEMMEHVIRQGRSVIFLIPEIALTYQTVMRLYLRFSDKVSILHSRMSPGERYDQLERARSGDIRIIVGPRSALFTPFSDIGLIIIDEEHESSYKSEAIPRYHARETAIERARLSGASVVLGSATPTVESYYESETGHYKRYDLPERATASSLPDVEIVDLRAELNAGNRSIISRRLAALLEERLDRGEQSMLFLNRRGMAGFVSCRACGEVIKCPHCDVSLSLHGSQRLVCHYCGYTQPMINACPKCGSKYIGTMKLGTEKVESVIRDMFPKARTLRMDADTTKGREGHSKIIETFADHGADILIGTQMIVKGHDFSDVSLMGILTADISLNASDHKSSERTFQLLTQACGRAGRRGQNAVAVIQTYQPEHFAVVSAAGGDYRGFYKREISYRKLLSYPPFGHILFIEITSKNKDQAERMGRYLAEILRSRSENAQISDPADCSIARINDVYRKQIVIRSASYARLVELKDIADRAVRDDTAPRGADIWFDFDQ